MTEAQIKLLADFRSGAVRLAPERLTPDVWGAMDAAYQSPACMWSAAVKELSDISASLAEMIEGLVGERGRAARGTIQARRADHG